MCLLPEVPGEVAAPRPASAAIFMGGFGTGVASTNMFHDVQTAESNRIETINTTTRPGLVQPASLTLPDQV